MLQADVENSILSLVDPKVLSLPIQETYEPMIDLLTQDFILVGPSPEIPDNMDYTKLRLTVYQKLVAAQKLLPLGLRFCLYEGYRSLALQEKLFNDRYNLLKNKYTSWSHEQLFQETVKLISPVLNLDGSPNIPPHATGAAFDVYLIDDQGMALDMGIKPEDWMKDIDGSLSQTFSTKISDHAKKYRAIMSQALEEMGFVNYLGEYWHWSYGDKYWAYHVGQTFAIYGVSV